ncbi:hypothetical protein BDV96DRAFT_638820 [Lophiotrema nucula]|uniref:Rhodopsin domain-containing protein n=1 Tax=Lophiotrema nucula TaxID=690887 RepID=A0A6A5YEW7_9PLEO|nr:hypothetical protein BDV96DRAFT_638820 [Lophiotrema nucula]
MSEHSTFQQSFPPGYLEEYNGHTVIAYSIVFLILQCLFLGLRFWSRHLAKVPWGWDDGFMVASAAVLTAIIATSLGITRLRSDVKDGGVGYHAARVALDDSHKLIIWAKFMYAYPFLGFMSASFPKIAILFTYLRIFDSVSKIERMICKLWMAVIILNCVVNELVGFFACRPMAYAWNKNLPGGRCINITAWLLGGVMANIVTDVVLLVVPIPTIVKMKAPMKVKIGLAVTFITGSIGLVTAIIWFVFFCTIDFATDPTWTASKLISITIANTGLYFIAGCLLAMRPLLRWTLERVPVATTRRGTKSHAKSNSHHNTTQKSSF